MISYEVAKSHN